MNYPCTKEAHCNLTAGGVICNYETCDLYEPILTNPKQPTSGVPLDKIVICWGWMNKNKEVQGETYGSVGGAMGEMCKRLSLDISDDHAMDSIYMLGFKLVQVTKTVSVIRILD